MVESIYDYLQGIALPTLPQEIDYETFCSKLMEQWEQARLAILEDDSVPTEMYIPKDALPPISDDEV